MSDLATVNGWLYRNFGLAGQPDPARIPWTPTTGVWTDLGAV